MFTQEVTQMAMNNINIPLHLPLKDTQCNSQVQPYLLGGFEILPLLVHITFSD